MLQAILGCAIKTGVFNPRTPVERFNDCAAPQFGIIPSSVQRIDDGLFMLCESTDGVSFILLSSQERTIDRFTGETVTITESGVHYYGLMLPIDHGNAAALRSMVPWTGPSRVDTPRSFGFGDRIGGIASATPYHAEVAGKFDLMPILAQQSVRENTKTGRTFVSVLDDATWAVVRAGFAKPWGADADHLKTIDEIEAAAGAGYTFFTLDPSEMIDNAADTDSDAVLNTKLAALFPCGKGLDAFIRCYEGKENADTRTVVRSGVKYLAAVRHAAKAYHRLDELKKGEFNFEMSIDETSTPTTALDHRIIATELADEDVRLFSLAPRFIGRFEKGIDYIGDASQFRSTLKRHVELSQELGGYRLSLHSGSDKFSVYPAFGEMTDGFFHVKTAGTSFLEAVKTVAARDLPFFKKMYELAIDTFEKNAASYEISADVSKIPSPGSLDEVKAVKALTVNIHMRQVLHIAFGVILQTMGNDFRTILKANADEYRANINRHLGKHLALLTGTNAR